MTDVAYLTVRNLPKPLHAALTKLAAANRRSINAEVVMAIEGHITGLGSLSLKQSRLIAKHAGCSSSACLAPDGGNAVECVHVDELKRELAKYTPAPKRAKGKR